MTKISQPTTGTRHKKKKILTPNKNKAKANKIPRKKKPSKKKSLKVNPGGQPEGKKNYTRAETLHMPLIFFLRTSFQFVWRSGKSLKPDMLRLGLELIEMYCC